MRNYVEVVSTTLKSNSVELGDTRICTSKQKSGLSKIRTFWDKQIKKLLWAVSWWECFLKPFFIWLLLAIDAHVQGQWRKKVNCTILCKEILLIVMQEGEGDKFTFFKIWVLLSLILFKQSLTNNKNITTQISTITEKVDFKISLPYARK